MLLRSAYKFNPDFYCTVNGLKAIMYLFQYLPKQIQLASLFKDKINKIKYKNTLFVLILIVNKGQSV